MEQGHVRATSGRSSHCGISASFVAAGQPWSVNRMMSTVMIHVLFHYEIDRLLVDASCRFLSRLP